MNLIFEHHYQKKYLTLSFDKPTLLSSESDVLALRQEWMKALSSWHSPYKAVIDGRNLTITDDQAEREKLADAWKRTLKLLEGFFLKKAAIWGLSQEDDSEIFPFEATKTEAEAFEALGIRLEAVSKKAANFRDTISFQNHFRQQAVELTFSEPVKIDDKVKMQALRSKLTNNLMQWHSPWNLLIDCSNLEVSQDQFAGFESMLRFFQGFFLKEAVGYSPKERKMLYPFKVYRSRHQAAADLEAEGSFSADEANCQTRKPSV